MNANLSLVLEFTREFELEVEQENTRDFDLESETDGPD